MVRGHQNRRSCVLHACPCGTVLQPHRIHWPKAPDLPVVSGELTGSLVKVGGEWKTLIAAQADAGANPEFKGSALFVETHDFPRKPEDSPNPSHGYHESGNAETYSPVGAAWGRGMMGLSTK